MEPEDRNPDNMFHRVGLRVGAKIAEGEYERAMILVADMNGGKTF